MSSSSLKLFGTTGLACGFRNTKKRSLKQDDQRSLSCIHSQNITVE